MMDNIVVCIGKGADRENAAALAERIGAPLTDKVGEMLTLMTDASGISLLGFGMRFQGDFSRLLPRITNGRLPHEMLIHAAKPKETWLKAVDAAAGMGEDAFLLAAAGYDVTLYERNTVVAALLRDAMDRAKKDPLLKDTVGRMHFTEGDSTVLMKERNEGADLVYLDPMFPPRQKTGLVNKKLQLIQKLEQPCVDEKALFDAAVSVRPKKIIIKRPLKGAYLAGSRPSYTITGKAIRYDCYVFPEPRPDTQSAKTV